jgi:hypothetical protein
MIAYYNISITIIVCKDDRKIPALEGGTKLKEICMKNTIKVLGILLAIAAAIFVAACGPIEPTEPEPDTWTVTFKNGDKVVKTETVEDGNSVNKPANLAKTDYAAPAIPKTAGFYKLNANDVSFEGWSLSAGGELFTDWPYTPAGNQTFYAKWGGGGDWASIDLVPAVGSTSSELSQVIDTMGTPEEGDQFAWVLDKDITKTRATTEFMMTKKNSNLTITSSGTTQNVIKSTVTGSISFFLIGGTSASIPDPTIKLTLKNIILEGIAGVDDDGNLIKTGTLTSTAKNALVTVRNGATLTLDDQAVIRGHRNGTYNTVNGAEGNGSAVCVMSATLNMLTGSMIEQNEAVNFNTSDGKDTTGKSNRNYVGGVYTIKINGSSLGPTLDIKGGVINNNYCQEGNTKDVYATEGGTFNLSGATTIGELTINADPATAAAVPATIIVSGLNNPVGKLSLRSSGSIADVKTAWDGKHILLGPGSTATNPVDPAPGDVAKFTLEHFKSMTGGFEVINDAEYGIGTNGKLVKK